MTGYYDRLRDEKLLTLLYFIVYSLMGPVGKINKKESLTHATLTVFNLVTQEIIDRGGFEKVFTTDFPELSEYGKALDKLR